MSFKQHNKTCDKDWLKSHRLALIMLGIPEFILDNERSWNYVLLHGDDAPASGWNTSWITKSQATEILRLLDSYYQNKIGLGLFMELKKKINEQ